MTLLNQMNKGIITILLLVVSNLCMTFAWYGHLQFKKWGWFTNATILTLILISWFIAFFEYIFMVPANKIGYSENGGPFNLFQLKIIQEVITLIIFTFMTILVFKTDKWNWNYLAAFVCIILAVYFVFKK